MVIITNASCADLLHLGQPRDERASGPSGHFGHQLLNRIANGGSVWVGRVHVRGCTACVRSCVRVQGRRRAGGAADVQGVRRPKRQAMQRVLCLWLASTR